MADTDDEEKQEFRERAVNWFKAWPVLVAMLLLTFNVEVVIMNILSFRYNIIGWHLFYWAVIWGNIELLVWVWLMSKIGIFIKENPGFKSFYSNIKSRGLDKIFRKTLKSVADKLDPENKEYLEKIKMIKVGYFDMFIYGVCIGAWALGIVIFRTTKWYGGLAMLMIGNTVKLGFFAAGYSSLGLIFIPFLMLTLIYKINKVFK